MELEHVLLLVGVLHVRDVRDGQVPVELLPGPGAVLSRSLKQPVEIVEGLPEVADLRRVALHEDLERECLVDRVVLGDRLHSELSERLDRLAELPALHGQLRVPDHVPEEVLSTLFTRNVQTLHPLVIRCEHI